MAVTITATKPAKQPGNPSWATNAATRVEPTLGQKQSGWIDGQRPPFNVMNWLQGFLADWAKYAEDATDELDAGKLARSGVQTMQGNIIPDADGTRDLGSIAVGWETLYAHDVVASNELDAPIAFLDELDLNPTAGLKTTAAQNVVNSRSIPKAWATVRCTNAAVINYDDGFNIASIAYQGGGAPFDLRVTFAHDFTSSHFAAVVTDESGTHLILLSAKVTGHSFDISIYDLAGAVHQDFKATNITLSILCFGTN